MIEREKTNYIHGGQPAISECRLKFCSTPAATITLTISRCSRENRHARSDTETKRARICGDPAAAK